MKKKWGNDYKTLSLTVLYSISTIAVYCIERVRRIWCGNNVWRWKHRQWQPWHFNIENKFLINTTLCVRKKRKNPKSKENLQFVVLHGVLIVSMVHTVVTIVLLVICNSSLWLLGVMSHCCLYLVYGLGEHINWNLNKHIVLKASYLINHYLNFYTL